MTGCKIRIGAGTDFFLVCKPVTITIHNIIHEMLYGRRSDTTQQIIGEHIKALVDKAIGIAKLKQKAAGARRRVSTKREALGQTNERGGPDSPRESLGAVPHIEPVKKKGFLAKMKGLLTRGKSKSGRSSKGERKKSLAEESVTKLNLSAESTSAPSTPRYGATSSALSAAPAPSSDSIVGTPRYKGSCDAAAPTEAPAVSVSRAL